MFLPITHHLIEEINNYKERADKKIAKNESILRGLETFFWGISSYSLCKWLVLNLGSGGINLAIAIALVSCRAFKLHK